MTGSLQTPVALIIYNRPDLTEQVFERIRVLRPQTLLVIGDGPKSSRPADAVLCEQTRNIVNAVDWPCRVLRNYSAVNLGCRRRVSTGIDWVFENVDEAIILEDDCLPDPTFFQFCEELLCRYRNDERVMMIAGHINHFARLRSRDSYYFSRMPHIWGWATWKRAWLYYDVNMDLWPKAAEQSRLSDVFSDPKAAAFWRKMLTKTFDGEIDTWDYQWMFSCWMQNGVCITPANNLVTNIGFRRDATHTKSLTKFAGLDAHQMRFPLQHPEFLVCDADASAAAQKAFHGKPDILTRIKGKILKIRRAIEGVPHA